MIFAALLIQGVTPGPFMIVERPDVFWGVIASMYVGNVILLILNLPLVGLWVQLLKVPFGILGPIIAMFTTVGCYSLANDTFSIYVFIGFGIFGYILRKLKFEPGPMVMAFILAPLIENAFRQALLMSDGSMLIFVNRPISGTLMVLFAVVLIGQLYSSYRRRKHNQC